MFLGESGNLVTSALKTDKTLIKRGDELAEAELENYHTLITKPTTVTLVQTATSATATSGWADITSSDMEYTPTKSVRCIVTFTGRAFIAQSGGSWRLAVDGVAVEGSTQYMGDCVNNGSQMPVSGTYCLDIPANKTLTIQGNGSFSFGSDDNGGSRLSIVVFDM